MAAADAAAGSVNLTDAQSAAVQTAVDAYGDEGDSNGVTVGYSRSMGQAEGTTDIVGMIIGGEVSVVFSWNLQGNDLAAAVVHEGVHISDDMAYLLRPDGINGGVTHYDTETRAWTVESFAAQGLRMNYAPHSSNDAETLKYQIWNKGWRAADVETMRSRGVANIVEGIMGYTPAKPGNTLLQDHPPEH